MKKEFQTIEEVLAEALQMQESGFSDEQIFSKFKDEARDLKSFFETIEILKKQTVPLVGTEDNFRKVLASVGSNTFLTPSPIQISSWWKRYGLAFSAGALALLIVVLHKTPNIPTQIATDTKTEASSETLPASEDTSSTSAMTSSPAQETKNLRTAKMPAPTGSIDDAINEINASSSKESAYNNPTRDKQLVAADQGDISNFANTSYENLY